MAWADWPVQAAGSLCASRRTDCERPLPALALRQQSILLSAIFLAPVPPFSPLAGEALHHMNPDVVTQPTVVPSLNGSQHRPELSPAVPSRRLRDHNSRLSRRIQAVPPSGIRRYFDIAATMENVISLGIGEPDFVTPLPVLNAGIASMQRGNTAYTSNAGMIELRCAIVEKLATLYGGSAYDPETEVLITVGVSEAMYLIMQAILDPGDEVIVPQPCFVSYTASVLLAGAEVVDIPTYARDDFQVRPADIEAAITPRTKAILIGFPCNPTGAVMDREDLLEIARIAEEHDLIVISDEIYDRLVYAGSPAHHVCGAAWHARPYCTPGRHEQRLCHDRLAYWLCVGPSRPRRRHAQDSPVSDHVGPNHWSRSSSGCLNRSCRG